MTDYFLAGKKKALDEARLHPCIVAVTSTLWNDGVMLLAHRRTPEIPVDLDALAYGLLRQC